MAHAFGAGVLGAVVLAAQASPAAEDGRGKALYDRHCVVCHGLDGRPDSTAARLLDPAPGDFADPIEASRRSFDEAYRAIKDGRPGTAMGAWGAVLGETEIGDLIDYIRTLSAGDRKAALSTEQVSREVGRRIFERDCSSCHGGDGSGDTQLAKLLRVAPTKFADPVASARLDDGRMFLAIYKGRPGTAMGGQGQLLTRAEIIDVMRYIRTLARPLPAGTTPAQLDQLVGERVYRQYCVACHGDKGDGHTALGEHLNSRPFDFSSAGVAGRVGDDELAAAIRSGRPGTAMAPWEGVLNKEDVRRVIAYIRHSF